MAYSICIWAVRSFARPKLRGPQEVSGTTRFGISASNVPPAKVGMKLRSEPG